MFYTGVRTGEAIAIRWDHVNLEQGTAEISRSISVEVESSTKTGAPRTLKLLPKAIEALENQAKYTEDLGYFVFHDPVKGGRWQDDQAIRKKAWHPTIKASGVGYRKPYQTRHTYATLLLMGGEDERFIMNQLGHSSLSMLHNNYGKILPDKNNPQNYKLRNNWDSFEDTEKND
jgi:integrase